MTQTVTPSVISGQPPSGSVSGVAKNSENQSGTIGFSSLLSLLGGASLTGSALAKPLLPDAQGGQDLPLDTPADDAAGESLPLFTTLAAATQSGALSVSVGEDKLLVSALDVQLDKETSVDLSHQAVTINVSVAQPAAAAATRIASVLTTPVADAVALVEETATDLLEQTAHSLRGAVAMMPTDQHRQQLLEHSLRIQQLQSTPGKEQMPIELTTEIDAPLDTVQTMRPVFDMVLKSADQSANLPVMNLQTLRQLKTLVTGAEPRVGNEALAAPTVQSSTTSTGAAMTEFTSLTLNAPLQKSAWGQELTDKIQWMVNQRVQGAEIKLNPAHLGPMEVKIHMQNDQATVQFTAAHTGVREALEAAMPRLREMFDNQGVQLGDVDVSEYSFAQQRQYQDGEDYQQSAAEHKSPNSPAEQEQTERHWTTPVTSPGRLDLFA